MYKTRVEFIDVDRSLTAEQGWVGFNIRWVVDEATTGTKAAAIGYAVFPTGSEHKLHLHENAEEFVIYMRGKGRRICGDTEYEVNPGDIVHTPRGLPHGLRSVDPGNPIELFCLYIGASTVEATGYSLAERPKDLKQAGDDYPFKTRLDRVKPDERFKASGIDMRWVIDDASMGSEYGALGYAKYAPGAEHKPHRHDNAEEFVIYTRGKGVRFYDGKEYEVEAGDIVYTPKGVVHGLRNTSDEPLEMWVIYSGATSFDKTGYTPVE
jgi:quercetin dioxygenase-like cupin family protein